MERNRFLFVYKYQLQEYTAEVMQALFTAKKSNQNLETSLHLKLTLRH